MVDPTAGRDAIGSEWEKLTKPPGLGIRFNKHEKPAEVFTKLQESHSVEPHDDRKELLLETLEVCDVALAKNKDAGAIRAWRSSLNVTTEGNARGMTRDKIPQHTLCLAQTPPTIFGDSIVTFNAFAKRADFDWGKPHVGDLDDSSDSRRDERHGVLLWTACLLGKVFSIEEWPNAEGGWHGHACSPRAGQQSFSENQG